MGADTGFPGGSRTSPVSRTIHVRRLVLLTIPATIAAGTLHALVLTHLTTVAISQCMEEEDRRQVGGCVRQQVSEHFGDTLFGSLSREDLRPEVSAKLLALMRRHDGFRIKVYDPDGTILWSDEPRLIGRAFPDNVLANRALAGELVSKIEEPRRTEHVYEHGAARYVTETYVPLYSTANRLLGVVEVYRRSDETMVGIARVRRVVWTGAAVATTVLCAALGMIVGFGQRRVLRLQEELVARSEELAAEKSKLEAIVEGVGAGLCLVGHDRQILWTNRKMVEWAGAHNGLVGQPCYKACWGRDGPCEDCPVDAALVSGRESHAERTHVRSDSRERRFHIVAWPIRDASGTVVQSLELIEDVTEQTQLQAQVQQAAKLAAVGELAGGVAHEVNNPIAIISAKARLLLSDHRNEMSEKTAQELAKIVELADRVARIAQGLLSYCRPSSAMRAPLDIRLPIRKAVAMVEQRARANRVRIEERLPDPVPLIRANADEMEQVFLNLFLNALDATSSKGSLSISTLCEGVRLLDGRPCVAVAVEDTGAGIPTNLRERIFEPFFSTKGVGRGTGLGLSICLGLVRSHGGEIGVDSEAGRGARFTVKLPIETRRGSEKAQRHG